MGILSTQGLSGLQGARELAQARWLPGPLCSRFALSYSPDLARNVPSISHAPNVRFDIAQLLRLSSDASKDCLIENSRQRVAIMWWARRFISRHK